MEEEKGMQESDGSKTLQENSQNQLTWAYRDSQNLNQQPGSLHETDIDTLHICYSYVAWPS